MKIKNTLKLLAAVLTLTTILSGCGQIENEALTHERDNLKYEIAQMKAEKESLESTIIEEKIEKGVEKYILVISIKQSHMNFDPDEMLKDSMNAISIEIPVDKEFYDSVDKGTVLDNSFRSGSFLMNGSVGSWDIKVKEKKIV